MATNEVDKLVIDISVIGNAEQKLPKATQDIEKLGTLLSKNIFKDASGNITKTISTIKTEQGRYIEVVNGFGNAIKTISGTTNEFGSKIQETTDNTKRFGVPLTDITYKLDELGNKYKYIEKTTTETEDGIKKTNTQFDKQGNIVKSTTTTLDAYGNKTNEIVNNNVKLDSAFKGIVLTVGDIVNILKKAINVFTDFIKESNSYVENLNLFRVTFGELADEAERYVNTYSTALGLDPSQVMRNLGFFNQMITGFGIANDKAYKMSKTLNQIAYDLSSFINIPIEDAVQKVQSGIAGELEPLRRVGYALDEATLQQIAYNAGITKSIRVMTQAEKAQIRLLAIYQQSVNVMGDLAGTLSSPANQLRILQQQITLLKRAIGNTFIPILNALLPYVNGVVQGLTNLFTALSQITGFKIQGIRATEAISDTIDGVTESADEATNAIKGMLLPFDNFISLSSQADTTNGLVDLEIPTYDALAGLDKIQEKTQAIAMSISKWFVEFDEEGNVKGLSTELKVVIGLLGTLMAIKVYDWFVKLGTAFKLATTSASLLNFTLGLLSATGVFVLIVSITKLIEAIQEGDLASALLYSAISLLSVGFLILLSNVSKNVKVFSELWTYLTIKLIPALKTKLLDAISSAVVGWNSMSMAAKLAALSIGAVLGVTIYSGLTAWFETFDANTRKTVGVITTLVAILGIATGAWVAFHTAASFGVGLPIILASIGAGIAGVSAIFSGMKEIKAYSNGGVIEDGIFTMNKGEMAGKFNDGTNVVANNKQITEGIANAVYPAVYNAIIAASKQGGSTTPNVKVYIGAEELTKTVYKEGVRVGYF